MKTTTTTPQPFSPTISFILFPSSFETGQSTVWLTVQNQVFGLLGGFWMWKSFIFLFTSRKQACKLKENIVKQNKESRTTATPPQFLSKWLNFHPRLSKIAEKNFSLKWHYNKKISSWVSVHLIFPLYNSWLWNVMFKWQHYRYAEFLSNHSGKKKGKIMKRGKKEGGRGGEKKGYKG